MKYLNQTTLHQTRGLNLHDEWQASLLIEVSRSIVFHYFNLGHLPGQHTLLQHREDIVNAYASKVFTLGLFHMNLCDSVKEGDGDRLIDIWKYLPPLFKASKNKNYAIKSIFTLVNYYFMLSPRLSE